MPGFGSWDQYIASMTQANQTYRAEWNKNFNPTTAAVAGEYHFLTRGAGNPPADALFNTGTNLAWQPVSDTTANAASIQHGGNVYPYYKYIANSSAFSAAATTMPSVLTLVDLLGFYRVTSVTTITAQGLTNSISSVTNTITAVDASTDTISHTFNQLLTGTRIQLTTTTTLPGGLAAATDYYVVRITDTTCKLATSYANATASTPTVINITDAGTGTHTINTVLPRYTNGAGVQAVMWNTNATALGAATPNLSFPQYTNSAQTTGRATPTTLPIGKTAASNTLVLYSGTGSGKYGPFVPLQAGDSGIAKIDQVQISVSYVSGEFSIALVRPLIRMPMTTIGVASEREFFSQVSGGAQRIYDGAALYWMLYSAANTPANSGFFGHLDFVWN